MYIKSLTLTTIVLVFSACQLHADVINSMWVGGEEINGNIRNIAGARLGLEDLEIEGSLINPEEGRMGIKGKIDTDDGDLQNSGLILVAPNSEFYIDQHFHNSGQVKIFGGACGSDEELENDTTGVIEGSGFLRIDTFLINQGRIYADSGSLTIGLFEEAVVSNFSNNGVLGNKPLASLSFKSLETIP